MQQDPGTLHRARSSSDTRLRRILGGMSIFTMLMTIPQVLSIWVGHQEAGVSMLTWSTYLVSAILWFLLVHEFRHFQTKPLTDRDRVIAFP